MSSLWVSSEGGEAGGGDAGGGDAGGGEWVLLTESVESGEQEEGGGSSSVTFSNLECSRRAMRKSLALSIPVHELP